MKYCALASGSNGNCYYVAHGSDAVLIDVGINAKHVELRMQQAGLSSASISAIFITHEHSDHIRGLSVFCKRYQIPVYLTAGTYKASRLQLPEHLVHIIAANARVQIGSLWIIGIPKFHDALEPCSFVVTEGKTNIAILTDLGRVCANVEHVVHYADVLLLESNYDVDMLEEGRYSFYLKNRIRSGWGHISNTTAYDLFTKCRSARLKHLILGHLSGQNNRMELVQEVFAPACVGIKMSVASRWEQTEVFDWADLAEAATAEIPFLLESSGTEGR